MAPRVECSDSGRRSDLPKRQARAWFCWYVAPPMPTWMYGSEVGFVGAVGYFDPVWEEEALRSAETYVSGLAERLRKTGLHVETRALRGEIASTIHAVSDETDTDLVVMSTHAGQPWKPGPYWGASPTRLCGRVIGRCCWFGGQAGPSTTRRTPLSRAMSEVASSSPVG